LESALHAATTTHSPTHPLHLNCMHAASFLLVRVVCNRHVCVREKSHCRLGGSQLARCHARPRKLIGRVSLYAFVTVHSCVHGRSCMMSLRAMSHAERAIERIDGKHPHPSTKHLPALSLKQLTLACSHNSLCVAFRAHLQICLHELRTFSLRIEHPLTQPHFPATANAATLATVWSLAVAI
jgi:hypothetical protein